MRWQGQELEAKDSGALPGLEALETFVPAPPTPGFAGLSFMEVAAKSALNHVAEGSSVMAGAWTLNPYRGCSHACVYCFARGSHRYLDLDTGADFDRKIVVKTNIAEVLRRELAGKHAGVSQVMLGTNTDPYQRAEGRYRLMPGIIDAFVDHGVSFSILTKGTLIRRDLDRLVAAAGRVHVGVAMSIAVYDDELQQLVEPGTPTTTARLQTVRALADAGFRVQVFMMPILPLLADSDAHLRGALERVRDAGAASVIYGPLHLRAGVKPWYFSWLERHYPSLLPEYRRLYPGRADRAIREYRQWLAGRIVPLIAEYGLGRARGRAGVARRRPEGPSRGASGNDADRDQPTLFEEAPTLF